ncbi:MAG: endopeptidase La [Acidobacteria bacterium]|nr:endopeptidase La [Acidobacteriota bacterium]
MTEEKALLEPAEQTKSEEQVSIPTQLPVLPLKDIVTFPFMIVPLFITREKSVSAVDHALAQNRMILLVSQRDVSVEDPSPEDIYQVGTVGVIMRLLKLPDQKLKILVQGLARAYVRECDAHAGYLTARLETIPEPSVDFTIEVEALVRNVKRNMDRAVELGKSLSPEVMIVLQNLEDPGRLADLTASNLDLKVEDGQKILETIDPVARLRTVNEMLTRELELLDVQQKISIQAKGEIEKSQREYFLRQQLKAIQSELGEGDELAEEINQYRKKLEEASLPEEAREEANRQINRLEHMHPDSAETSTVRNYLDWIVNLPWSTSTEDRLDLTAAQKILDEDHYDLESVKTRILEYLAVLKLKKDLKGPILCFVGPPGVGKTSLGKSIARALGRKFGRMSLGGVHDEAEIRGHRRTYVGAMPGRIIQALRNVGTNNPVIMLDEVDKIGADFRGDPSSALLEVLDPEQNNTFRDNFLGVPFDLSRVLFITTANQLDPIQPAFLDRMEVIRLSGYSETEKLQIAKRYLIPKQLQAHGVSRGEVRFLDSAILTIINSYTREAGLRNLEREIASIFRKVARKLAEGEKGPYRIGRDQIAGYLGVPKIQPEELLKQDQVGIATALAWTPEGGDILFVEAIIMKGKGNLILTGQLGDVMKESAQAAMSYARARAKHFKIPENLFESSDFHIHVPEGAIPKDGPSAGVTMATALISACTSRPVHRDIALTGEITLRGHVLPVGGIKEKVLAARRAKIKKVVLPRANQKHVEDLPVELREEMQFLFVDEVGEVIRIALWPVQESRARTKKNGSKAAA